MTRSPFSLSTFMCCFVAAWMLASVVQASDMQVSINAATKTHTAITKIAFASCHNSRKVHAHTPNIWKAIGEDHPSAFVWTGDAVYPRQRQIANISLMTRLLEDMKTNASIGYSDFLQQRQQQQKQKQQKQRDESSFFQFAGVFGTWDDHDFGGNDVGREVADKMERQALFYDFLGLPEMAKLDREGLYYSVTFSIQSNNNSSSSSSSITGNESESLDSQQEHEPERTIKLIVLDTRSHRGRHCFPSVATYIPLGAGIAAMTRWILAGLNINRWWPFWDCWNAPVLGEAQWKWLEQELLQSQASVHIVVSSIQVLTTNPTVENWGHFPSERQRLLTLLGRGISGLILLSGDVHHADILDPLASCTTNNRQHQDKTRGNVKDNNKQSFLEVTSSGMTHFCSQPFYGFMCQPLLEHFNQNRYKQQHEHSNGNGNENFYIGRNYGTIEVNWEQQTTEVFVKNEVGEIVLRTGPRSFHQEALTQDDIEQIAPCVDGHLVQPVAKIVMALAAVIFFGYTKFFFAR